MNTPARVLLFMAGLALIAGLPGTAGMMIAFTALFYLDKP
jgi:hypothetical protein